jgi:hypothetical protein
MLGQLFYSMSLNLNLSDCFFIGGHFSIQTVVIILSFVPITFKKNTVNLQIFIQWFFFFFFLGSTGDGTQGFYL